MIILTDSDTRYKLRINEKLISVYLDSSHKWADPKEKHGSYIWVDGKQFDVFESVDEIDKLMGVETPKK